jgi:primosomal protein N' (replication factor Y)
LCRWGQVLNAIVPQGVRRQAGTVQATFIEAATPSEHAVVSRRLSAKQQTALTELQGAHRPIEIKELARRAGCGPGPIAALVEKGYARRVQRSVERHRGPGVETPLETALVPNADQERAWQPIQQALNVSGYHAFLLHGVTGSGKTELYLRAIQQVVGRGQQALVLVPEISLTPQTIQRFRGRFGAVAVLHSHQSASQRAAHWRRVAAGEVQVVVGARSAVFAPAGRLGLIIVDEEHETTFKQETTPRYHGRDVAVMRARMEGIPVILGSATPSLESWHNAQRGQYTLLRLPGRVQNLPMPQVQIVDLRHQGVTRSQALCPALELAMREALRAGGQIILLLNRRGFSTCIRCPSCGAVETCKFCDLALTHHQDRNVMLCHHCGYEESPPKHCVACGAPTVRFQGIGTEKLEAEVRRKFVDKVVGRMDSDSMRRPGSHAQVLDEFRAGRIHILLGTQMIAKGLDFPNVTLVGVVNADVGLHIPDFRSAERTFQLLAQVAGRAGRGPAGGRVIIQTFNPEQPCIDLAAGHSYEAFVEKELENRRAHNYPPFQRLARVVVRSRDEQAARDFAESLSGGFATALQRLALGADAADIRLLGPAEAPVFRLKGQFRFHFQLQSSRAAALHDLLGSVLPAQHPPAGVYVAVDIDPVDML